MLSKQQKDNRDIQEIIDFYEYETAQLARKVKLGDLSLGDDGKLRVCNKIFGGKHFWTEVNNDGTLSDKPRGLQDP